MADTRRLTGGCHCGAVRYAVETNLAMVIECNCSHCAKKGFVLTFAPADAFTLEQGEESLGDYFFNKRVIRHRFCKICGVESFAEGDGPDGPTRAINLRCVEGLDLASLDIKPWNGASQ